MYMSISDYLREGNKKWMRDDKTEIKYEREGGEGQAEREKKTGKENEQTTEKMEIEREGKAKESICKRLGQGIKKTPSCTKVTEQPSETV